MMLWDGSPHHWFGKEHKPCCAMVAMDDAKGSVLALFFVEYECSAGYFELLRRVVRDYGIPGCVYQDRHSALKRRVEVRQLLDGSWRVYHQNKLIATAPASEVMEPIRAKRRSVFDNPLAPC